MMVVLLLLTSCRTTSEIELNIPDFPTLENPEDAVKHGDYWIIKNQYWIKMNKYIADCEKCFEELKAFDKTTIIK